VSSVVKGSRVPFTNATRYNAEMRILSRTSLVIAALTAAAVTAFAQATPPKVIPPPSDVAAPPADAVKTASGLATKVITPGTGSSHPAKDDLVTIDYTGWTTDGKMFDSSIVRGKPSTFGVNRVIAGFSEGLQLMVPGEKRRLWVPEALAYKGAEGKPKGTLVFDVQLIDMPNRPPADVKAPPADAKKTASGLAYKVLREGVGGRHPKGSSDVTVNYTGWTTDGKMFDSSIVRGQPATFGVNGVIPGWTEGLQLMVEGEKVRFWIPEKLAYKGQSPPYGMLVFDVELIKIQ
jgi:FKBP-type peptidyl-prolyl cis-trans isomerase